MKDDVETLVLELRNVISADLDLDFRPVDVCDFISEKYPFISSVVREGIAGYVYRATKDAYNHGGLSACNIILRHLSEEGDK